MKLFIDEDTGSGLGRALRAVGIQASYVGRDQPIRAGTPDEVWLPWAGREGSLVLSRNIGIFEADAQKALLILHRIGILFLPQHLSPFELLRLVFKKWEWLETLDSSEPRPFAFRTSPTGRPTRLRLETRNRRPRFGTREEAAEYAIDPTIMVQ